MNTEDKIIVTGEVSVQDSKAGTSSTTTENVKEVELETPYMNVGMSLSKTVNLGNYENVKVQVSMHCPCKVGEQEPVFDFVLDWCDTKLSGVLDDISKGMS